LPDNEPLPAGQVTVSVRRWQEQRELLLARYRAVGIRVEPEDDVLSLTSELDRVPLIAIDFPTFAEGRGYSQARLLRERLNFKGEIRALNARRDHLSFMERCGIDAFELADGEDIDKALGAFDEILIRYQPAADPAKPARAAPEK
jgi:uncharacterized protein (DUF934 family)